MSTSSATRMPMSTRVVVLLAALFAIACVLTVGHKNPSGVLNALFVVWVFAPFAALGLLIKASSGWDRRRNQRVAALSISLCAVAVCVYGTVAFVAAPSKPAFWFLVLPPASLTIIAITYVSALRTKTDGAA